MSDPIYAIGDIHGHYDKMCAILDRIDADGGQGAKVIFLGDLTDRGPQSKAVIQHIIDGRAVGRDWTVLMGNHDKMFGDFLDPEPKIQTRLLLGMDWLHERLGGRETLESYGVEFTEQSRYFQIHEAARRLVPQEHYAFLKSLPLTYQSGAYLFVHAGIMPNVPLEDQKEEDLFWIREPFLSFEGAHPFIVVHGHSPVKAATHYGNHINLDTGAGYGCAISCMAIDSDGTWLLEETGRRPLVAGLRD